MILQKLKSGRFYAFSAIFLLVISTSNAQEITMEQTLAYISGKLGSDIKIDLFHGVLNAKYSEGGQLYREDEVNVADLDTNTIHYDSNEQMFSINCKSKYRDCVQRQIPSLGNSRPYERISYFVKLNEKSAQGLRKAYLHMIRLVLVRKYKSNEPFE